MPRDAANTADTQITRTTGPRGTAESLRPRVPGLVILSHPEPRRVGEEAALIKLGSGQTMGLSRREPDFAAPGPEAEFQPLDDSFLSRTPLNLSPGAEPGSVILDRSGRATPEEARIPRNKSGDPGLARSSREHLPNSTLSDCGLDRGAIGGTEA
jgi:hypothetical protein